MKGIMVMLASLFALSTACVQNKWAETLSCVGQNITEFPNVTDVDSVSHIDILNTSMVNMPDISQFPNLMTMDVRDNEKLKCEDVLMYKDSVILTTDCDDDAVVEESCDMFDHTYCIDYVIGILDEHKSSLI